MSEYSGKFYFHDVVRVMGRDVAETLRRLFAGHEAYIPRYNDKTEGLGQLITREIGEKAFLKLSDNFGCFRIYFPNVVNEKSAKHYILDALEQNPELTMHELAKLGGVTVRHARRIRASLGGSSARKKAPPRSESLLFQAVQSIMNNNMNLTLSEIASIMQVDVEIIRSIYRDIKDHRNQKHHRRVSS